MTDLKDFLKTSQRYINILKSAGITSLKKFFEYWPRDYEDRRKIKKVSEIVLDNTIQIVKGKVVGKNFITTPTGKKLVEIELEDEDSVKFKINYLNASYWLKQFKKGKWYLII
jgi:ATP-dependent DNA helicase RecG